MVAALILAIPALCSGIFLSLFAMTTSPGSAFIFMVVGLLPLGGLLLYRSVRSRRGHREPNDAVAPTPSLDEGRLVSPPSTDAALPHH